MKHALTQSKFLKCFISIDELDIVVDSMLQCKSVWTVLLLYLDHIVDYVIQIMTSDVNKLMNMYYYSYCDLI